MIKKNNNKNNKKEEEEHRQSPQVHTAVFVAKLNIMLPMILKLRNSFKLSSVKKIKENKKAKLVPFNPLLPVVVCRQDSAFPH